MYALRVRRHSARRRYEFISAQVPRHITAHTPHNTHMLRPYASYPPPNGILTMQKTRTTTTKTTTTMPMIMIVRDVHALWPPVCVCTRECESLCGWNDSECECQSNVILLYACKTNAMRFQRCHATHMRIYHVAVWATVVVPVTQHTMPAMRRMHTHNAHARRVKEGKGWVLCYMCCGCMLCYVG